MKVLLDEGLPYSVSESFSDAEWWTVAHLGWRGIKNGQLLSLAESQGFKAAVTLDQNIPYQQRIAGREIVQIILKTKNQGRTGLSRLYPQLAASLKRLQAGTVLLLSLTDD